VPRIGSKRWYAFYLATIGGFGTFRAVTKKRNTHSEAKHIASGKVLLAAKLFLILTIYRVLKVCLVAFSVLFL